MNGARGVSSYFEHASRAAGWSICASLWSAVAGWASFVVFIGVAAEYWVADQDLFLVGFNVLPMSFVLGCASWVAQLIFRSQAAMGRVMLALAVVLTFGLVALIQSDKEVPTPLMYVYFGSMLVPGLVMIAAHWMCFEGRIHVKPRPTKPAFTRDAP